MELTVTVDVVSRRGLFGASLRPRYLTCTFSTIEGTKGIVWRMEATCAEELAAGNCFRNDQACYGTWKEENKRSTTAVQNTRSSQMEHEKWAPFYFPSPLLRRRLGAPRLPEGLAFCAGIETGSARRIQVAPGFNRELKPALG